jgi:glutamine amidotransferase
MIGILDYGMGNVGSIVNMLRRISVEAKLVSDPADLTNCDRLILPGVGAFDAGMTKLAESGLRDELDRQVRVGKPVLGICLGMQLLARRSEEGKLPGLGWIEADVIRFQVDASTAHPRLKVPHMGWNLIYPMPNAKLFASANGETRFYFVHSYRVVCDHPEDVAAEVEYGGRVTAAVERDNVYGVQFHPEKSHKFGMRLLAEFAKC